jgi:uncharacterized protein DUF2505
MRELTLVHEMDATVDGYWAGFFDPAYESAAVAALKFREYNVLELEDTDTMRRQRTRAVPKLDVAAAIAKLAGSSVGYVEDAVYDKATRIMRLHTVPDALKGRISIDTVVRVEPGSTATTCRRTLEVRIEARAKIGAGMFESAVEKNVRTGWAEATAFLNDWLRKRGL